MRTRIHAISGGLALTLITTSFLASVAVAVLHQPPAIMSVKRLIMYGVALLIPALALGVATGQALIGKRRGRLMQTKQRRGFASALTSLLILAPCAVTLYGLAARGQLHGLFYAVQGLEFAAEGLCIVLLSLKMRDGFRLTGRLRKRTTREDTPAARKTAAGR